MAAMTSPTGDMSIPIPEISDPIPETIEPTTAMIGPTAAAIIAALTIASCVSGDSASQRSFSVFTASPTFSRIG